MPFLYAPPDARVRHYLRIPLLIPMAGVLIMAGGAVQSECALGKPL